MSRFKDVYAWRETKFVSRFMISGICSLVCLANRIMDHEMLGWKMNSVWLHVSPRGGRDE
jgi:hypothetical protein